MKLWGDELLQDLGCRPLSKMDFKPCFNFIHKMESLDVVDVDYQSIKHLLTAMLTKSTSPAVIAHREELKDVNCPSFHWIITRLT